MNDVPRRSPVHFDAEPQETEERGGWRVALAFHGEGDGPWLVDLSHRLRWDVQDRELSSLEPLGLAIPQEPGQVAISGDFVVNRMNRTQAALWHLGENEPPAAPDELWITEVTDGQCMLAVVGEAAREVMEHVTDLDLFPPGRELPSLTQGPVLRIPGQVVSLGLDCVAMTFSRGYGQAFAEALLRSASPTGLRPGGERRLTRWFAALDQQTSSAKSTS